MNSNLLLIVQLTEFSAEGHGEYRVHGPARRLSRIDGITVVDCDPDHRWASWMAEHADVLILHTIRPDLAPLAHRRRGQGKATLLEASDHYFDVQPWSAYSQGWLDRNRQEQFWHLLSTVDAVQTSTEVLARYWEPSARQVFVFPNQLPEVPALSDPVSRPLTLGWVGTSTHLPDWYQTAPTLASWCEANPSIRLHVMTDELAQDWVPLEKNRYTFTKPGSLSDYTRFLQSLDVCVVPLLPGPFNLGRTDLKFTELAAHGVIGIFSAIGPYPASVKHGKTGFLFQTHEELRAILSMLVGNVRLRNQIRQAAYAEMLHRHGEDQEVKRLDAYRSLLTGPPAAVTLPAAVLAEGRVQERYLALPPGPPERAVKRIFAGDHESVDIGPILKEFPEYLLASRAAARKALLAGKPEDSLALLEPLLSRRPDSPELLLEYAQSLLSAHDPDLCRDFCERALSQNPALSGAWNLLLRVSESRGFDIAATLADRAAYNQPRSYLAALVTLKYQTPAERRRRLFEYLDRFTRDLHPEEQPYLAAAFGRVIAELIGAEPDAIPLLKRACDCFPDSARMAEVLGKAMYRIGETHQASLHFQRALRLSRVARTFDIEFTDVSSSLRQWSVAEYALRHSLPRSLEVSVRAIDRSSTEDSENA